MSPLLQRLLGYSGIAALAGGLLTLHWFRPDLYWPEIVTCVCTRLLYVGYVGWSLLTARNPSPEPQQSRYARFRIGAQLVMHNDVTALIVLCWVTRNTFDPGIPPWAVWTIALTLGAIGFGIKAWAASAIGDDGYYWRDCFFPPRHSTASLAGPYRWIKNPMYTVGYAHAYGLALAVYSLYGLIASAYYQIAILTFLVLIEKPNFNRVYAALNATAAGPPPASENDAVAAGRNS